MIKLSPSILSADFANLGRDIEKIDNAGADYIHIDVMDGVFVPNISIGLPVIKDIRKITNKIFDVHLMIANPDQYIEDFANAGADIITFHYEASKNPEETINKIKSLNKKAGMVIKPNTNIEVLYDYIENLDLVLIMSVEPGFGGQKLIPETLDKVKKISKFIKNKNLKTEIEVDGGITLENVEEVLKAGANVIVAGSAVYNNNPEKSVKEFYNIFEKYNKII